MGLSDRLEGLADAVARADGRLPVEDVSRARVVLDHAGERLSRGPELTVVALAGATGSGKSSIFNAFAGTGLSSVGARRPTTGEAYACIWSEEVGVEGDGTADVLLDWLGVKRRHRRLGIEPELAGMVLLDLPDHDSTEVEHRLEVDRLADLVDLLVWVVDPQKYADAALHDRYLRPLAGYGSVMVVALNHIDRLEPPARRACLGDLGRLLREDGLGSVPVIATSARTGEGLGDLRAELARRVSARRAATERLAAEVDRAAATLASGCGEPDRGRRSPDPITPGDRAALVQALAGAANVDMVVAAVRGAHKHRARAATGWPFTRWVRRLRPDPLARLHLARGRAGGARTSLPGPTEVQRAAVGGAIRTLTQRAGEELPAPWPALVRRAGTSHEEQLPDLLDRTVGAAEVDAAAPPAWWRVAGALQLLFAAIALAGFAWLALLFGFEWLQLPDPPTPEVARIPLPTLMLLGGVAAGLLLALIARALAHLGAKRRARAARRRLLEGVGEVADIRILDPIRDELGAYSEMCAGLRRARGGRY